MPADKCAKINQGNRKANLHEMWLVYVKIAFHCPGGKHATRGLVTICVAVACDSCVMFIKKFCRYGMTASVTYPLTQGPTYSVTLSLAQ